MSHIEKLGLLEEKGDEATHEGSAKVVVCTQVRQKRRRTADDENET
jgi:hypothetical protein